ncbi:unnamed protein product [Strongylus vulgaris]|uniref:Uncharacterized protein n=1 Tax=Strongylus vulgaris TaxID=40348 RepID=A0A3P7JEM7_STRVU|nr:unnamed protein product [Strongylus vulgaris]
MPRTSYFHFNIRLAASSKRAFMDYRFCEPTSQRHQRRSHDVVVDGGRSQTLSPACVMILFVSARDVFAEVRAPGEGVTDRRSVAMLSVHQRQQLSMFGYDDSYGYSTALLAVAPYATQLALGRITWMLFFPLFALPAISLMLSIGSLSTHGPVLTYKRLAPIAAGKFMLFFGLYDTIATF